MEILSDISKELLGAFLGSLISTLVIIVVYFGKSFLYFHLYNKYTGDYIAYLKDDDTRSKQFSITLKRKRNKFIVSGSAYNQYGEEADNIKGEIEMSTSIRSHREGYYFHFTKPITRKKFGFYEIQLAENEIFVHQIIKGIRSQDIKVGEDKSAAYIWEKIG